MFRLKECIKCKLVKLEEDFYKHPGMASGYLNKCKDCCKKEAIENRNKKIDHYRKYDRERAKKDSRIANAISITREWRAQDKRRLAAHSAVARAIKKGDLVKKPCDSCGSTLSLAHHDNYEKPLDVRWMCQSCHKKLHEKEKLWKMPRVKKQ